MSAPEPMASLDLRGLQAQICHDEGDVIVVVHDGDVCFHLESGLGGRLADAIQGAERLATTMEQMAALLRVRAGSWEPFPVNAPVADQPAPGLEAAS
jgi:hypothetical protein